MLVECELQRIVIRRNIHERQYIYLREKNGERSFPIVIGFFEAQEIYRKINGEETVRPLTHDLIRNVVRDLGARMKAVEVDSLVDNTFFAKLVLEQPGQDEACRIDCRPSDAIALAVAENLPISVDDSVLTAAPGTMDDAP